MQKKQSKLSARFSKKDGGNTVDEGEKTEVLGDHELSDNPAQAGVVIDRTVNLGNYESLKIGVSVTIPCEVADLPKTLDKAKDLAGVKLKSYIEEATS